jgi:membrane fusion protein, multidrug efflux system
MTSSTPPRPRHPGRRIAGAVALLLILGGLWLHERAAAPAAAAGPRAAPAVPVTAEPAKSEDFQVTLSSIGNVTPVSTVTLTSRVAGTLTQVLFQEGQMVRRGQLLAVIDPRPYQAAVLQAEGQLERDQALLRNARIDLARYQDAYRDRAIPEQQVATAQATVDGDEGSVKLDQGELDAAQVNLGFTRITSPIDGRVGLRLIDVGNNVAAGGTQGLATLTQLQPITVVFTLDQSQLPAVADDVRRGQAVPVEVFDRAAGRPLAQGKVLSIDNQIDPATGTIRIKAVFANTDDALWPGEFVDVRVVSGTDHGAVTVPSQAVQSGPNGSYVYVVKPDQTVEMQSVTVPRVEQGVAEVSRGLTAGEIVVVDGQYRLAPGARVALRAEPAGS